MKLENIERCNEIVKRLVECADIIKQLRECNTVGFQYNGYNELRIKLSNEPFAEFEAAATNEFEAAATKFRSTIIQLYQEEITSLKEELHTL